MVTLGGLSEADLVAMVQSATFDSGELIGRQDDWLAFPPDHIRTADFGRHEQRLVLDESPPEAALLRVDPSKQPGRLLTIAEMLAAPPTRYIVADLLPERGLVAIFGAPAAGKTFLSLDLAGAIASGRSHWFGCRVAQAPVVYVALEGRGGMRKRMKAWLAQSCSAVLPNIRFFTEHLALLDRAEAERIAHEIVHELGTGAVTFIDTLSRAMAGGDENSSVDMTTIVQNAELIGSIVQGPVILVHHTGKDAGKGPRGHSSLLGAVDVSLEVVNVSGCRSWTVRKNKDGEDGGVNAFELVPHAVDTDQWGDEVRSCAVRPLLGTPKPPLPPVTGKNKVAVMAALRVVLAASPGRIDWDLAVSTAAAALPATTPSARRNTVAKTTFNSLIGTGHLVVSNGKVCLP